MGKYKIVFHINETNKWNSLINNLTNLIHELGKDNVIVEVIANGEAVLNYVNNVLLDEKIVSLIKLGVQFTACRNSLKVFKVTEENLPPYIKIVNAGIAEIVIKQHEGFSYVKP